VSLTRHGQGRVVWEAVNDFGCATKVVKSIDVIFPVWCDDGKREEKEDARSRQKALTAVETMD
jgi:hypothetical protein